jgi:hypothetical protein
MIGYLTQLFEAQRFKDLMSDRHNYAINAFNASQIQHRFDIELFGYVVNEWIVS